jgi:DNA processing protein
MKKEGKIEKKDRKYPEILKEIDSPPETLRWRGLFNDDIFNHTLAVVGSRKVTNYGKIVTEKIVREIAQEGVTIVSGFMYGVDAIAHKAALSVGGKTIAVMPCGINVIHPAYQKNLYNNIAEKGLILSEFEDNFPPEKWTYPKRNRIVVGLSKAVLIIEAAEKSGSLISASFAKKYKRKIFAVPGPITSSVSKGTNNLIKEGGSVVTSSEDVLSFFNKGKEERIKEKRRELNKEEKQIVDILEKEMVDADTILRKTKMPSSKMFSVLSILELKGIVGKRGRNYYLL